MGQAVFDVRGSGRLILPQEAFIKILKNEK